MKFFRTCIALQDEWYVRQLTKQDLFEPILNIVYDTMPRDNLLNSVCLELFEFVKRENIKLIIVHVVENHREKLEKIRYVDTFQTLILRYDQMQEGYNPEPDNNLFESEAQKRGNPNGNQRWQGMKEMDATEEAYFNTSDDEDELANKNRPTKAVNAMNGVSPRMKSLVDYPDDDEDAMDANVEPPDRNPSEVILPRAADGDIRPTPTVPSTPPLERLSEKRRREEDDEEDELGKLSTTKRRSSSASATGSVSSIGSNATNMLRRKKAFVSGGKDSPTGSEKIKISLAIKSSGEGESKHNEEA